MSIYRQIKVAGAQRLLHRHIWEKANGPIPEGFVVHHVNHNKLDNRLENLTLMTYQEHAAHHNDKHARIKTCVVCESEYEPHATKRQRSQVCSPECKSELQSQRMVAQYGLHVLACETCGGEFRVPRCRAEIARFCSRPCANRRRAAA